MPATKEKPAPSHQARVTLTCEVCGSEYVTHRYRSQTSRYCSKACWSHRTPIVACRNCGTTFTPSNNRAKVYCSRSCAKHHMVGMWAPAWKDGKSKERDRAQMGNALREWRIAVFVRDEHRCRQCGSSGRLHAHHIRPFATHPESRLDIENGITLCIDCHGAIHGKNFRRREQSHCPDCGRPISRSGVRCRSCAIRHWHALGRPIRHASP